MKELRAKPKVTQAMTRDGLTLENQATGEVENISSREAEQDYTPEAGGTAEKLLERADDAHDRHKAKKSAKQAAATAAEGDAALHRPSSRLQLTEEERADPDLQPYIRKADKKADKLDAARDAIPKKRVVVKETVYDEATGKAKSALRFEQQDKGPPKLKPNPAGRPVSEALLFAHGKIHEVEHENVGVEGGHKGEELAERQAGRAIRSSIRHHKLKPYRAAEKAERQALAANAEYFYQKSLRDNPEIAQAATNPVSRFWQKQQIKRQYAKAARTAGQTAGAAAQGAAKTAASSTKAAKAAAEESKRAASFVARHWKGSLAVLVLGLLLLMVMTGLQSCTAMFGSAGSGIAASSYFSEDSDMLAAEDAYATLEAELQAYLDNYEATHDYDEYHFDLDSIEHDPYVLISILSAFHEGVFTTSEVQAELEMLFEKQYILTETTETETRYRTETRTGTRTVTDPETGETTTEEYEYEVQVPYTYYICNVKLENFDLSHVPVYIMGEETLSLYATYMSTLGNREDLFPSSSYVAKYTTPPTTYDIPASALEDETFAALITEAEKYIGYPYVWGGSNPNTSFDCSGFVSWALTESGVCNTGRLGAQGLYNISTPVSSANARPGDLIFFVGTYDTPGVSHVGIYVGGGKMLHCGDPIQYADINTSYWQSHFYAFGRPPYD